MFPKPLLRYTLLIMLIATLACAPLGLLSEGTQPDGGQVELPPALPDQTSPSATEQQSQPATVPAEDWPYQTGGPPAPKGFTAQPYDELSIHLQWQPDPGAERYLVERKIGQFAFEILSEVSGSETEALDFLAPQGETVTYRLHSLAGSQAGEPAEATALLPALPVEPLLVAVIPFESAAFDPNDISSLFSSFDDDEEIEDEDLESLDFTSLFGGESTSSIPIGPAGGRLTATFPDGAITYTLDVPEGALRYEIELSLAPVQSIDGLPFSGGLAGAVDIQPFGVIFDIPAILTIEYTDDYPADSLLTVGFTVDGEISELSLYPYANPDLLTTFSGKPGLASLSGLPFHKPRPKIFTVQQSQTYGETSGSPTEINRQVQRGSSSTLNTQLQKVAASDMADELAPIRPIKGGVFLEWTNRLGKEMAGSISLGELSNSLYSFQAWMEELAKERKRTGEKDKYAGREAEFWNLTVENIHIQVNLLADRCKNPDSQVDAGDVQAAKSIVDKLMAAKKGFWKQMADRYKAEHGNSALSELKKKLEECVFTYRLPLTQVDDITLSGEFCPDRPFTLEIGGSYAVGAYYLTPTRANQGVSRYSGAGVNSPWTTQGSGTWKLMGGANSSPQLKLCDSGKVDIGKSGGGCYVLDLIRTDQKCASQ